MKPQFEKVPLTGTSFLIKEETFPYFDIPWHFHPEFEIALLRNGQGKRHVGSSVEDLESDELIFIGPNLPHNWYGNKSHPIDESKQKLSQIVIQFSYEFLGKDFFEQPPFANILQLLKRAQLGISFYGETRRSAKKEMTSMLRMNSFNQTMALLVLLEMLSESQEYKCLSSLGFTEKLNDTDAGKINKIYKYIVEHFKEPISLNQVAELASMTPQSFCKYFKTRTKKTFSFFLNEVKVNYACRLLAENNLTVLQVCYEAGYNNLSNFNRQFKRIIKMTPTQYISQFNPHGSQGKIIDYPGMVKNH